MASGMTTSKWIKFFIESGLPPNVAANYAIIFTDHRIQMDMLLDLSKEYLFDMGIKTLGDVIAILRHAKVAHNQAAKEKMIVLDDMQTTVNSSPRKSTPASRMLDHYTRRMNEPNEIDKSLSKTLVDTGVNTKGKGTIISLKRKIEQRIPVKRIRRVLPEHEGSYKVTMPSGTTEKTRKILQQKQSEYVKRSVFSRLGDNAVSSSTDVTTTKNSVFQRLGPSKDQVATSTSPDDYDEEEHSVSPLPYQGVLKITGLRKTIPSNTVKLTKVLTTKQSEKSFVTTKRTSIMKRLGPQVKASRTSTNTYSEPPSLIIRKSIEAVTGPRTQHGNNTNSAGIFGTSSSTRRINIKNRLGKKVEVSFQNEQLTKQLYNPSVRTIGRMKITLNKSNNQPPSNVRNVFQRLGAVQQQLIK